MPSERAIRIVLCLAGIYGVVLGLIALIAPGFFFDDIGRYGTENTHYVGDNGAFTLAFGLVALIAIVRPSWRVPVLALGALWFGLHALNHAFDVDEARSDARGISDTVLLALTAVVFAWLAVLIDRTGGSGEPEPPT